MIYEQYSELSYSLLYSYIKIYSCKQSDENRASLELMLANFLALKIN